MKAIVVITCNDPKRYLCDMKDGDYYHHTSGTTGKYEYDKVNKTLKVFGFTYNNVDEITYATLDGVNLNRKYYYQRKKAAIMDVYGDDMSW